MLNYLFPLACPVLYLYLGYFVLLSVLEIQFSPFLESEKLRFTVFFSAPDPQGAEASFQLHHGNGTNLSDPAREQASLFQGALS